MICAQVLNVFDRRYGFRAPLSKLAPAGHEQLFSLIPLGLSVPQVSDDILRQSVSEASTAAKASRGFGVLMLWPLQVAIFIRKRRICWSFTAQEYPWIKIFQW